MPAVVGWFVRLRWLMVPIYLGVCGLVLWVLGMQVGTELFPQIDSGEFVLRFRPPPGSNFELTRQMAVKCLEEIENEAKPENIEITMGYVGQVAPNFGIDNMVLFMRGPDDGQLRVALTEASGIKLAEFRERLRKVLPERVIPWLATRLEQGGLSHSEAQRQAKLSTFGFEPGDIVTSVMSFGSLTPIAVRVVGTDLTMVRQHAEKIAGGMRRIPFLRDVEFEQQLDYPTVEVEIDREKAGLSGAKVDDVAKALVMATASTRFASLNYWIDVKTGFDYLVQLQMPPLRMEKPEDIEILPLETVNPLVNLMIRDVATVRQGVRAGEIDRDMSQRYLTLTANVEGEDMGRASRQVAQAIAAAGEPPRGVRVETLGQLPPMNEMFAALGTGLAVAVFVIFVLLTAYFQSPRLALISIGAVPGVLAGIAIILYFTNTSINIESFMGSIMCLGVSVSNSVMLVTFMDEHWKRGTPSTEAAIKGAEERLRPILMTACAMTVGMVPMALALERGSQMQAPLGRAVIGGLVMSTFATLLVLPSIFAVVIGPRVARSPSLSPEDPDSTHYDPEVFPSAARPAPNTRMPRKTTTRPTTDMSRRPRRTRARMHPTHPEITDGPGTSERLKGRRFAWCSASLAALALPGCHSEHKVDVKSVAEPPTVRLIQPPTRTIVRTVGQPSFVVAYERTSIYPKLTAYIEKWIVDIGDKLKKDQVLATLFVPELVEDYATKKATVVLDQAADHTRPEDGGGGRCRRQGGRGAASPRPRRSWANSRPRSTVGTRRSSGSRRRSSEAWSIPRSSSSRPISGSRASPRATRPPRPSARPRRSCSPNRPRAEKARVDVEVARADLSVAESEKKRLEAWVGYLTLTAPFDGVVVVRNANTFDFVLPATGDPTAMKHSPDVSPGGAAPIYVVDRTDVVRVFVDVPEQDANYVQIGTKASVLVKAYRDDEIPASVTRTSWALNVTSRTLRAEIDLPNTDSQILPGMYAYAKVIIERPGVRALPVAAVTYLGDRAFCWQYEKGVAVQTEIQTGVSDGEWIEVTKRRLPAPSRAPASQASWAPIDGSEQVILGDLSILVDGAPVRVLAETGGGRFFPLTNQARTG